MGIVLSKKAVANPPGLILPLHFTRTLGWYIDAVAINCIDLVFLGMVSVVLNLDINRGEQRSETPSGRCR